MKLLVDMNLSPRWVGMLTQAGIEAAHWSVAPSGRLSHPREEHLLPLMVASGAGSDAAGRKIWSGTMGPTVVSAWAFD